MTISCRKYNRIPNEREREKQNSINVKIDASTGEWKLERKHHFSKLNFQVFVNCDITTVVRT